jgi:uncharacterized protein
LVRDIETLQRIKSLVIPPAWSAVWTSLDPLGHIQVAEAVKVSEERLVIGLHSGPRSWHQADLSSLPPSFRTGPGRATGSTTAIGGYPTNDHRRRKVPAFGEQRGYLEPGAAVTVQLMKPWEPPMQSKLVAKSAGQRTFVMILDPGEEAFRAISDFAAKEGFSAASLTALGAFSQATVGWFDLAAKTYCKIPVAQQCEVLSAVGDIAIDDNDKPSLHAHVVLGLSDGTTRGGHLLEGLVRPTLEVTLVETPAHLRRKKHPELGIALIDVSAAS